MAPYGELKCNSLIYETGSGDVTVNVSAIPPGNDPTFTGVVTVPTPAASDNSTKAASTAFVQTELADYAALTGATFSGTINGTSLVLSGDLQVNGNTTTIDSTNTTIKDNLLELNSGASSNANDSGIIIERGSTGDNAIFAWDESADKFIVGTTTATAGSTGNISVTAGTLIAGTLEDSKGNLRSIPVNAQSSSATYVAATSDAGKSISATGTTQTVELSGSAGFSAGDAVTIINGDSTTLNITATNSLSLRNTADAATGNRALAQYGMATVYFVSSTVAYISGAGLS